MTSEPLLRIETDLGEIVIAVHVDKAPLTAAYVRQLADDGLFTDTSFYRSTTLGRPDRLPLIQGGPMGARMLGTGTISRTIPMLTTFETTADTGIRHRHGTVSLARDLLDTGHAMPELFLCLGDYPELDAGGRTEPDERGFPAFGTVVAGDDVVAAIAAREANGTSPIERLRGEILTHPVRITNATIS